LINLIRNATECSYLLSLIELLLFLCTLKSIVYFSFIVGDDLFGCPTSPGCVLIGQTGFGSSLSRVSSRLLLLV
jgi:hypothetical protein